MDDLERLKSFKYKWVATWNHTKHGWYARATVYLGCINGKSKNTSIFLHRFIMNAKSTNEIVDHILPDKTLDNRKSNLRITTVKQNSLNRDKKNRNNTSGYRNISKDKRTNEWLVQLQINGKNKIKRFASNELNEAVKYRNVMQDRYYGEYKGNN